ncbi:MAG: Ig-like domain-containing protein [Gaiellaceae bacterium]
MKVKSWATRVAILGLVLVGCCAVAASPAFAVGSPTVTTLESSQNPSAACGSVTFTATVHGLPWPASPLGGVQFFDGASTLGGIQLISWDFGSFFGVPVPTDHSSGSIKVQLSGGTHIITVLYGGTDLPSTGGPLVQNVTAATSTTVVTSAVNPSVFGQPVPLTAAVSSSCSGSVAGSVQFQADGIDLGAPQPVDGSGHATLIASSLSVGNHPIAAVFTSSNSDVKGSSGSLIGGQTVNPADTTTSVSSSSNPSEFGAAVTFTATTTVNSPGAGTATGSVQFQADGTNLGAPQSLAGGQASIATSALSVGSHTISASFTSDSANFNNSSGSTTQIVNPARTTLSYDGTAGADFNDPALLSARLTRTDNSAPVAGKTVTLTMGSESCVTVTNASGEAACTITPTEAAGPSTVTAAFSGDGNYLASTDSKPFTVSKEETTTTYTGPTVIAQGNPVTLSGRLLEDGVTPIAGRTLTLTLGSGLNSQTCLTGPTDASGNAQCTLASVTVTQGSQPVKAAFVGDGYYLPSADATKNVIIFAFPARGIFVLGDQTATSAPTRVTFWGSDWATQNTLTGGSGPSAFKGFADSPSSNPPACGGSWTSSPGNSSSPVASLPAYMGTAISTAITKTGNTISGTITKIVVVVTNPGYAPNPGHPGTGTIIATYC